MHTVNATHNLNIFNIYLIFAFIILSLKNIFIIFISYSIFILSEAMNA